MEFIDAKFKDIDPATTVASIKKALKDIGVEVYEVWHDSGVENCCSLTIYAGNGFPNANGKGITREFAQASAYGEFIERLQSGLFFYKHQSFECDPDVNLQCYAPDGKYFTKEELAQTADWMDYIISEYKGLTKESLLKQFEMYAHTDDGRILCLPFYSLFEDKYVYLPAGFIEHMYSANGCCVGNTREEALVHAFSEIMERRASIAAVESGRAFPRIPEEVLKSFPTVYKILTQLRETDHLDVAVFDCSTVKDYPVISTRIINKDTQCYITNFAADPVLEIAIERTLTEIFQGRNILTIGNELHKPVLTRLGSMRSAINVLNQLETGSGLFTVDYFAEELTCDTEYTDFEDNSGLTNPQLLTKVLGIYKQLGRPVFVRNYNFLGMPCYKVIVPGFSESRGMKLTESVQEYGLGHEISKILRNPKACSIFDFRLVTMFKALIKGTVSRQNNFAFLSGIHLDRAACDLLLDVTYAYCAYRLNDYQTAAHHIGVLADRKSLSQEDRLYFACVRRYLTFKSEKVDDVKIFCVLGKLYRKQYVDQLKQSLEKGTPFDKYLLNCDTKNCDGCRYKQACHYDYARKLIGLAGIAYSKFTDGQNPENFVVKAD